MNQLGLNVEGIPVNVKPISFERSGSLAQFMEKAETVLDQKEETVQKERQNPVRKDECIFGKIANGEIPSRILYEDETFRVILDISP